MRQETGCDARILPSRTSSARAMTVPLRPRRAIIPALISLAVVVLAGWGESTGKPRVPRCIAVVGASIAEGYGSAPGENWPALVAGQLKERTQHACIRNISHSGTRLLITTPDTPSYLDRELSALDSPGLGVIVLTDLINDIQAVPPQYDPDEITAGIRRFVAVARERDVRVLATTLTPYGGYRYTDEQRYTPAGEKCRRAVNAALRRGGIVDGVIDFDSALADPGANSRLRPDYDSGDHLHPSTAGQHAMADIAAGALAAIPLTRPGRQGRG